MVRDGREPWLPGAFAGRQHGARVAQGARGSGVVLTTTLDVDRPDDLEAAELFLTTETKR